MARGQQEGLQGHSLLLHLLFPTYVPPLILEDFQGPGLLGISDGPTRLRPAPSPVQQASYADHPGADSNTEHLRHALHV